MVNFILPYLSQFTTLSILVIALGGALFLLYNIVVIVAGNEIAVIERRWFGQKMPQGRVVAMSGEIGIQARTLGPGMHFLIPFLFVARKNPFLQIQDGEIGIIETIDGNPIPAGRIFAQVVEGHNAFQDGEAFLRNGGQKGPQIQILPPGKYRINPHQFNVTKVPTIVIERGKVGIVTSMDGQKIPSGRLLGQSIDGHSNFENGQAFLEKGGQKGPQIDVLLPGTYRINTNLFRVEIRDATIIPPDKVGLVTALDGNPLPEGEFIAKSVTGHNDYQNAQKFLGAGGQRGPQLDVLRPGTYYINPLMLLVELDDVEVVERGQVSVHIANVGAEPTEKMKRRQTASEIAALADTEESKEQYVVPNGYRGIQEDVAGPGRYYLNRRAFIPYIIDTTNQTLEWDASKNTRFDSLKVISNDGFQIEINVKVVVRVRPEQSPYLVAKVGSIENLALNVIHPMIDSLFRTQASSISAMNFLLNRQEEQSRAEERARKNLIKYHVECVSVLICQVILPDELMQTQTRRIIAEQQKQMYVMQQQAEAARVATEKTRATADQQSVLVQAEIDSQCAYEVKSTTITVAEGEARKIELIGQATADVYNEQKRVLGQQAFTAIEMLRKVADGNVRITPDVLVSGENGSLIDVLMAQLVKKGTAGQVPANATSDFGRAKTDVPKNILGQAETVSAAEPIIEETATSVPEALLPPPSQAEQSDAVAQQDDAVAQQDDAVAQQDDAVAQQDDAVAQQDDAVAQQDDAVAQQNDAVAQQNDAVAQQRAAQRIRAAQQARAAQKKARAAQKAVAEKQPEPVQQPENNQPITDT